MTTIRTLPLSMTVASVLLASASAAHAQTCNNPLLIFSNQLQTYNSCEHGNSLPFVGPVQLPHPDVVFAFEAGPHVGGEIYIGTHDGQFSGVVLLTEASCSTSSIPVDSASFGYMQPATIDISILPAGTYSLIVSGNPDIPGTDHCGPFWIDSDVDFLDVIFGNGFET